MTKNPTRWIRRIACIAAGCATILGAGTAAAQGGKVAYVLTTSNVLYTIDTANPRTALASVTITGIDANETLAGIDVRPRNGGLYGVAVNAAADTTAVYYISPLTGVAAKVGPGSLYTGDLPDPAVARYGVDIDSITDRLHVTSSHTGTDPASPGVNVVHDPNSGGVFIFVPPLPGINPAGISIDEVASTNGRASFCCPAPTTLYTISSSQDALYIQSTPNAGTQTSAVPLSQPLIAVHGFDLDSDAIAAYDNGPVTAGSSAGYAVVTTAAGTGLTRINLLTGDVGPLAPIAGGITDVRGFAVHSALPGNGLPAFGLNWETSINRATLLSFNTAIPWQIYGAPIPANNVAAGEALVGMDMRPRTGQLFALGHHPVNNTIRIYRVYPDAEFPAVTATSPTYALPTPADRFAFDFDPTEDLIRVITNGGHNIRISPSTFQVVSVESGINPAGAVISGAAFTNNFSQAIGAGNPTTLYTLDATNDRLAIQAPLNSGTQTSFLPVTRNGSPLDFTDLSSLDIPSTVRTDAAGAPATGVAYALMRFGAVAQLYTIDLSSGAATLIHYYADGLTPSVGLALGEAVLAMPAVTVTPAPNPSGVNTVVTFTATVAPAAATGTVDFRLDDVVIPTCTSVPLNAGTATCQVTFPVAGSFAIGATYSGNADYFGTTSPSVTQIVNKIATTTTLALTPARAAQGDTVTMTATVAPADATGDVTFLVDGAPAGTVALSSGQATFSTSSLAAGSYQVTASYGGSPQHDASSTSGPLALSVGNFRQHFAEGATGSFFQTTIGIFNASAAQAAHVTLKLFPEGAAAITQDFTLDPLTRRTVDVNATLEALGIAGGVSTVIESDQPIAATRLMTWGAPVYGSTLESGVPDTSTAWYFAEGATGVFSLYYLIENPQSTAAEVTFTHLLEGGGGPITVKETVDPFSRRTFNINDLPPVSQASLSTVIASTVPIVAERAMYINTTPRQWEGGTASAGATAPSTNWSLAEGATGFFYTYLLLGNPNASGATVTVRYQLPDGQTIAKDYDVPRESRRTIDVGGEDPLLASTSVGMTISSTLPIVAERAMWWDPPFSEGSVAFGSTTTGTVWAIGEGVEGQAIDEATFVLVSNGSATAGAVRVTVVYDDGTREQQEVQLAGSARETVRIGTTFPAAQGRAFSVLVESLTSGMPITVEYSRYQSAGGFLAAGGAALATLVR